MQHKSKRKYYKDEGKKRDYNLFVIVTEGAKREVQYFLPFDIIDRIKVLAIHPNKDDEGSSPDHVLDRVKGYIGEYGLSELYGDSLWCVIDVDKWPIKNIEELAEYCKNRPATNLTISNPCIEVWLLLHKFADLSNFDCSKPDNLKNALGAIPPAGYNYHKYIPLMPDAILNARNIDVEEGYMPALGTTKVYLLAEALMKHITPAAWSKFLQQLPHIDVVFDDRGKAYIRCKDKTKR